ncbi:unnamed protein product [Schistosoma turkestanicum]|nr:unnamed protein product [Schistosoma turkestanicum]
MIILMQSVKLSALLQRENVIVSTTTTLRRLVSTIKSSPPGNSDGNTSKPVEHVQDVKKMSTESKTYNVPEYYKHNAFDFYDSEVQLKGFRLPQPNPS